jgi:hypothetical protein
MAIVRDTFTAGSNGNTLATTNTDADFVSLTGGTGVISTAQAFSATRSALLTGTVTSGSLYLQRTIASTTTIGSDMYMYWTALPSAEVAIWWSGTGTTRSVTLNVSATGQLVIRDAGGAGGAAQWTSTATMTTGTWYRVSVYATQHASTGTVRAAFYSGTSSTALADSTLLTGKNTGAAAYNTLRWGNKGSTSTATSTVYIDDYAYDTAATGLLPPDVSSAAPVLPPDPQNTSPFVFIDLSATTFDTGPITFSASPSTGVIVRSDGLLLPVNPDGSVTSYTITATDGSGLTDSMVYNASLPADVIETVIWSGSAWV